VRLGDSPLSPLVKRKRKKKQKTEDKAQSKRFIETARALGADESGEAFERALNIIAPKKTRKPN
jgi:hypothetical protein